MNNENFENSNNFSKSLKFDNLVKQFDCLKQEFNDSFSKLSLKEKVHLYFKYHKYSCFVNEDIFLLLKQNRFCVDSERLNNLYYYMDFNRYETFYLTRFSNDLNEKYVNDYLNNRREKYQKEQFKNISNLSNEYCFDIDCELFVTMLEHNICSFVFDW